MFLVAVRIQKPLSPGKAKKTQISRFHGHALSNIARENQTREFVDLVGGVQPLWKIF